MARRIHVLIVEDCDDTAVTTAMLLSAWGMNATIAHDGVSGLSRAFSERPDVILLDMGLPDMDGAELARRIRLLRQFNRTLIVAFTGYGTAEDEAKSMNAGCQHHLTKPVDLEQLRAILSDGLKEFRTYDPSPPRANRKKLGSCR